MRSLIANRRASVHQVGKSGRRTMVVVLALIAALGVSAVSGSLLLQWRRSAREQEAKFDWAAEQQATATLKERGFLVTANPLTRHAEAVSFMRCKQLQQADLQNLVALRYLIYVNFEGCNIPDGGLRYVDGLPKLLSLKLNDTSISDQELAHLTDLPQLVALYLRGTRISNDGLSHLAGLRNLQRLDVRNSPVTEEGLTHLGDLDELQVLMLTQITDAGVPYLMQMKNLKSLLVSDNKISEGKRRQVKKAIPGLAIDIFHQAEQ